MTTHAAQASGNRLGVMLFIAAGLHLLFILGVSFKFNDRNKPEFRQQNLEIVLVEKPKELPEPDEQADYLAQTSQAGGGDKTPESRPIQPEVVPMQPPMPSAPAAPVPVSPAIPATPRQVITRTKSQQQIRADTATPVIPQPIKPKASQLLASRDREIAHLTAELERKSLAYANLPKRKAISASTKEYKYAAYLDAWRRKVERIGNLNYPDEAKRRKLYGNMILHVAVRSDGSVEQVRILRSSGYQILDDAAVRIVRLAAPFSPFPQEINKEADILDITRTWQFTRSNQLGTK